MQLCLRRGRGGGEDNAVLDVILDAVLDAVPDGVQEGAGMKCKIKSRPMSGTSWEPCPVPGVAG